MAERTCTQSDLAVVLSATNGERLRYSVAFLGARAVFTLTNKQGTLLLSQASPPGGTGPWELVWPDGPPPNVLPSEFSHSLGMHFLAAAKYTYRVVKEDANGTVLAVVKDCIFESTEAEDAFFEPLSVFVV